MSEHELLEKPSRSESLCSNLIKNHWGRDEKELTIEGHRLSDLAEVYGTPLYVYSLSSIAKQVATLRHTLGPKFDLYYSVKANPNLSILKAFKSAGTGLEVASATEYLRAIRTGIEKQRILFAGPGKTHDELKFVIEGGIGEIHLESFDEISKVAQIADQLGQVVSVSIRVNPAARVKGGAMRMGGGPTAFGFDEPLIDDVINELSKSKNLRLKGLHMFAGTQILNADTLLAQWTHAVALAKNLIQRGIDIQTLDLGGGLGIPYFQNETPIDLNVLSIGAASVARSLETDKDLKSLKLMLEPGRFLIGPAGIYATRVVATKTSYGEKFAVTDGGMHHHLAASGNLGQVMKKDYPIVIANKLGLARRQSQKIVGPLCTPLDTYVRKTDLPEAEIGDTIAILQSGAYGLTSSPVGFLSHPMPAEILVDGNDIRIIRPRGTYNQPITMMP